MWGLSSRQMARDLTWIPEIYCHLIVCFFFLCEQHKAVESPVPRRAQNAPGASWKACARPCRNWISSSKDRQGLLNKPEQQENFRQQRARPWGWPCTGERNFPELEMSNCSTRRIRPGPKPKMSGRIWTAPNLDLDVKSVAWDCFWFIFKKLIVSLPWVAKCRKNGHGSSRLKSVRILFCSTWGKTFFPGCREQILPHLQARENHWKLWSE